MRGTVVIFPGHHVTCPGAHSEATGLCEQQICRTVVERAASAVKNLSPDTEVLAPPLDLVPLSGNGNQKHIRERKKIALDDRIAWLQAYPRRVDAVIEVHANSSEHPSTNYPLAVVGDDLASKQWGGCLAGRLASMHPPGVRHHVWTPATLGRELRILKAVKVPVVLCEGFFISSAWFAKQAATAEGLDALLWSYANMIATGVHNALQCVPRIGDGG